MGYRESLGSPWISRGLWTRAVWAVVLSMCCAAYWIRSYYYADAFGWRSYPKLVQGAYRDSAVGALARSGRILLSYNSWLRSVAPDSQHRYFPDAPPGWHVRSTRHRLNKCPLDPTFYLQTGTSLSFLGFGYGRGTWTAASSADALHDTSVVVPLYFLQVLLTIPALVTLVNEIRRLRSPAGKCVHCGYDLRATPDRCPECGTVVTPPAGSRTTTR